MEGPGKSIYCVQKQTANMDRALLYSWIRKEEEEDRRREERDGRKKGEKEKGGKGKRTQGK